MKVTEQVIYEDYVLQYPKTKLTFELWFNIIKKLIWEIASEITYNNGIWVPPHKIGFFSIIKFNSQKRQIGLIANKADLKPVALKLMRIKFNFDTFGYMFKTKWDRRSNYCRLRHRDYYKFKWEKPIKSMISQHVLSSHTDRDKKMADAPLNVV